MISNKLLANIFHKNATIRFGHKLQTVAWFSKKRGLEENIKDRQSKKVQQNKNFVNPSSENLLELSRMKFLNIQFFPITLLLTPTFFSIQEIYDPSFLLGLVLAQKYASLALMMNLDLKEQKRISVFLLIAMASLHAITGYYSIATPLGMALLTIIAPFKFCNEKQSYTESESQRMNTMTNIRIIYFFIFVLLTSVKAMHFESTQKLQNKLNQFNQENNPILQPNQQSNVNFNKIL